MHHWVATCSGQCITETKLVAACRPLSITIASGSALPTPGTPLPRITSGIKPSPLEGVSLDKGNRDSLDMRFASLSLIQVVGSSGSVDSEISAGTVSSVAPRWQWFVLARQHPLDIVPELPCLWWQVGILESFPSGVFVSIFAWQCGISTSPEYACKPGYRRPVNSL